MLKKRYAILFFLLTLTTISCSDNGSGPGTDLPDISSVYVVSEANFQQSNSTVASFNPGTDEVTEKAFEKANNRPFAGFIQTSNIIDDRLYLVSNNTNKIEVTDLKTLNSRGTIAYSKTPVSVASAGEGKAYVTNLYDNSVTIVDLEALEETDKTIPVGPNPYFSLNANGKVFISNNGFGDNNTISVIDTETDAVENTIAVGAGPEQIVEDSRNRLWVVCQGKAAYDGSERDPENDIPGGIYLVDIEQQSVVDSFATDRRPRRIALNSTNDQAFVLFSGGSVSKVDMNSLETVNEEFIPNEYNTIGYSEAENLLYLGKSNGLAQAGYAVQYNLQGAALDTFNVGISPIEFQFVTD